MFRDFISKILFVMVVLSFVITSGCKKMFIDNFKDKKLVGTWEIIPLGPSSQVVTWTFNDNDTVVQEVDGVAVTNACYIVNRSWVGYTIDFDGFKEVSGVADSDGNYDVLKNNKEIMILQRIKIYNQSGTPFCRIEFQRKQ